MPRQHVSSRLHPGAEQDEIGSQGLFRMYNFHCDFRLILVVFLPTEGLTGFASVFLWKSKTNSKQNSATHVCRAGELRLAWSCGSTRHVSTRFVPRALRVHAAWVRDVPSTSSQPTNRGLGERTLAWSCVSTRHRSTRSGQHNP